MVTISFHGIDPSKLKIQEYNIEKPENLITYIDLIKYLRENYEMEHVFESNDLPAGMLCMVNNVDIECGISEIMNNDHITFINSLHGG